MAQAAACYRSKLCLPLTLALILLPNNVQGFPDVISRGRFSVSSRKPLSCLRLGVYPLRVSVDVGEQPSRPFFCRLCRLSVLAQIGPQPVLSDCHYQTDPRKRRKTWSMCRSSGADFGGLQIKETNFCVSQGETTFRGQNSVAAWRTGMPLRHP